MAQRRRIDVHHHVLPAAYVAWLRERGIGDAGGFKLPSWSLADTLELMDEQGIATAILSVSAPGVHLEPGRLESPQARARAREVNEFAARIATDHPARFGFFATLTLPDVDGALAEACYALDELGASGVVLLANANGRYLGGADDEPLLAELDRRGSVVFVHPTALPGPPAADVPPFATDFLLDTTRAAYRLVRNGVMRRYPSLNVILSHAGGFVPYASHRLALAITAETGRPPADVLEDFASFYFDTALSGSPAALPSLLAFTKPGHVLFGSDWPFLPRPGVAYFTGQLDSYDPLGEEGRLDLERRNAEALFPRFAAAA